MGTFLVSYDLSKPTRNYEDLHEFLRSQVNWAKVLESVWIVRSNLSALGFVDAALEHMDADDHIFVTPYTGVAAWHNLDSDVVEWLKRRRAA